MLAARISEEDAQASGPCNDQDVFTFGGRHFSQAPGAVQKIFEIGDPDNPCFGKGRAVNPVVSRQSPSVGKGGPFSQ